MLDPTRAAPSAFAVHLGEKPNHSSANGTKIAVQNVDFFYGEKHALKDVAIDIFEREVTAFIGPSGCGKTTLLRCLNRSYETIPGAYMTGTIRLDGHDIHDPELDLPLLRRRFGWVAQRPNPFPWSVHTNVAYGAWLHGLTHDAADTDALVEHCLRQVGLWDEVKDALDQPGTELSGGQQQRLCIARALAYAPDILLMDEPASALDPGATALLENLIDELRRRYTIIIVTHNMQQAARLAQRVAMFHLGRLVETGDAVDIFLRPRHEITAAFLEGRFG
ncbi:phosphate ABC transporter ATP-binding protein [Rhabdaerophilum calidifontis]|uniref:phosphate ABC transporter ATP-binding protein n=1 Tax=Rhabdaerophilum calidifontis TaxID=2604328 RepID=UPI00123A6185|nr:phosphate ABC transporter ATP-binding protein [Rhabdaerophilum calidifontis]